MDVKDFITRYQEAFGEATPLPIAFGCWYGLALQLL